MAEPQQPKKDRFWVGIGKASALIGVGLASVNLYRTVWPDDARITANCAGHPVVLPGGTHDLPFAYPQAELTKAFAHVLELERITVDESAKAALTENLGRATKEAMRQAWTRPGSVFDCTIKNGGSKKASDIQLAVAWPILNASVEPSREAKIFGQHVVRLGDLHPDESLRARIWYEYDTARESEARLTHAGGRGRIAYPVAAEGIDAWFAQHWLLSGFMFFMLISMFWAYEPQKRPTAPTTPAKTEADDGGAAKENSASKP